MQTMIIVYLLGYLLELISTSAEEAYASVKVMYIGAYLVPVFAFFFLADYCNIRLHRIFIKAPMMVLSLVVIVTMWTTKFHHLIYLEYQYDTSYVHGLSFTPGPLYSLAHTYPMVCMVMTMLLLLYQFKKWANKYRKQLFVLLLCLAIPFVTEGIYYISRITGLLNYQIYLTPHSLALMSFCLYVGVMRLNVFEVISMATITAMDHIREGFILVDDKNNYLSSNPAADTILPGITKLVKGENISSASGWPEELKNLEGHEVEFSVDDKERKYFRASISPVFARNNALKVNIILLTEITGSVNLMKELENAAYQDSLTGLYNRKHFSELANVDIERALRTGQSIYTAMLDLDLFKNINDSYGHAAGDVMLKMSAGIMRQTIRSYDLVGRYGGEEFVLLITGLDIPEAFKLMERIRENIEHSTVYYEGAELRVTCSIGLAKYEQTDTLESSIRKADEALYVAKNSGRNQVKIYNAP